jgi:hypothetical protein
MLSPEDRELMDFVLQSQSNASAKLDDLVKRVSKLEEDFKALRTRQQFGGGCEYALPPSRPTRGFFVMMSSEERKRMEFMRRSLAQAKETLRRIKRLRTKRPKRADRVREDLHALLKETRDLVAYERRRLKRLEGR